MLHARLRAAAGNRVAAIAKPDHPNLVAMYTMDNVSGSTLFDETGNGHDGTISAGITFPDGVIGNAIEADAAGEFVDINSLATATASDSQGALSFLFYYVSGIQGNYPLSIARSTSNADYFNFHGNIPGWQEGSPALQITDSGSSNNDVHCSSSVYNGNSWNHAVIQSNGSAYEIWVNGINRTISVRQGSNNGRWLNTQSGMNRAAMFKLPRSSPAYSTGAYDLTRYFNRHLTANEISNLYNGGAGA